MPDSDAIDQIPFPEWNDHDVNTEKWDSPTLPHITRKEIKKPSRHHMEDSSSENVYFEDYQFVHLPSSITDFSSWRRPHQIYPNAEFVVYEDREDYPDLIRGSQHILHCHFVRQFISAVTILQYIGYEKPFHVEGVTSNFHPSTDGKPWKPWHHIYSLNSAGKDAVHNPTVNPTGKYIVRLFWMGAWRKIYVDDKLPIDKARHVLLPSLVPPKEEPPPTEQKERHTSATAKTPGFSHFSAFNAFTSGMSPLAMLPFSFNIQPTTARTPKGAKSKGKRSSKGGGSPSESPPDKKKDKAVGKDVKDKHKETEKGKDKISGKTGKSDDHHLKGKAGHGSEESILSLPREKIALWPALLCKALLKIACLTSTLNGEEEEYSMIGCFTGWIRKKIRCQEMDHLDIWDICAAHTPHYKWPESKPPSPGEMSLTRGKVKGKMAPKLEKSKSRLKLPKSEEEVPISFHIFGVCDDMRNTADDVIPEVTPCWDHMFYITELRNIPLEKPPEAPDLPKWKYFRWLDWAVEKGIIDRPVPLDCTKYLKCFFPFKKCANYVIYSQPSHESILSIYDSTGEPQDGKKKKASAGKDKPPAGKDKGSKTEQGSSKTSKGKANKESPVHEEPPPDPSFWIEFEKLRQRITHLILFFKPSDFKHKARVSNLFLRSRSDTAPSKGGKTQDHGQDFETVLDWKQLPWSCQLQYTGGPLHFFVDSLDSKLLILTLNEMGKPSRLDGPEDDEAVEVSRLERRRVSCYDAGGTVFTFVRRSSLVTDMMQKFSLYRSLNSQSESSDSGIIPNTYVIVERYQWFSRKMGPVLAYLRTRGTKSVYLDLSPGRYICRLWIRTNSLFTASLISDTPFQIGHLEDILEPMAGECHKFTKMGYEICSKFGQLVQKFGSHEFLEASRNFYRSYLPDLGGNCLLKTDMSSIHMIFKEHFTKLVFERLHDSEHVKALRTIFLDPLINQSVKQVIYRGLEEEIPFDQLNPEEIAILKGFERIIIRLQSWFRMSYAKFLREIHNPEHPEHMEIFKTLKEIYTDAFSTNKRDERMPTLLREFFSSKEVEPFLNYYSVHKDSVSSVNLKEFNGSINVDAKVWTPICRFHFYCTTNTTMNVQLFSMFDNQVIRIIDNDTYKDIEHIANKALVHEYIANANGYTVLCYGTCIERKAVHWKLVLITPKHLQNSINISDGNVTSHFIVEPYVPNYEHILGKYLLSIKQDTLLSFRLIASCSDANLNIKITDPSGNVIMDLTGGDRLTIPSLILKYEITNIPSSSSFSVQSSIGRPPKTGDKKKKEKKSNQEDINKQNCYVLEAFVVKQTWPLTKAEWSNVEEVQRRRLYYTAKEKRSRRSGKSPRVSSNADDSSEVRYENIASSTVKLDNMPKPYWVLQTLYNINAPVKIMKDRTREAEIREMKRGWYEDQLDRYDRSQQLRQDYLTLFNASRVNIADVSFDQGVSGSEVRTLVRPALASLPPFDLTPYYKKDLPPEEEMDRIVKTEEDEFFESQQREETVRSFQEQYVLNLEDFKKYMFDQKCRRELMSFWFAGVRKESEEMMKRVEQQRVEMLSTTAISPTPSKKGNKKK